MTFAEAIRHVRTARKLTQAELALRAGITRTTLVRLENGLLPGPLARQRLLGAFGFAIGAELFAAAGETKAIEHLANYAAYRARAKRLAAAPRQPEAAVATDIRRRRPSSTRARETAPILGRWRILA